MTARPVIAAVALAAQLAGCGFLDASRPQLGVSNGTTIQVIVTVKAAGGSTEIKVAPGGFAEIGGSRLPALPWTVEARTESGRLLTTMLVRPGDVTSTTRPDGGASMTSTFGRADLSCGRLDIWAGTAPMGPPPGPGVPGDCLP